MKGMYPSVTNRQEYILCPTCKGRGWMPGRGNRDGQDDACLCPTCEGHRVLLQETQTTTRVPDHGAFIARMQEKGS